jgi:hypothetical protein
MTMKTKNTSLLAVTALMLGMPFAANAGATISVDGQGVGTFSNNQFDVSSGTLVDSSKPAGWWNGPLYSNDNIAVNVTGATGTSTYDVLFTVGQRSDTLGSAWAISATGTSNATGVLYDVTHPSLSFTTSANGGNIQYSGLVVGDTYDWRTTGTFAAGQTGSFGSQFTVTAAVPEPEEWAMLLAGLGMIGLKLVKMRREMQICDFGAIA